jgi:phosphoesterase RecJ-like protein
MRLTADVLETLELLADGRVAVVWVDRAMLERTGAKPEDTENLINLPRSINGVRVAVMLKAFKDDGVRVSLRSRDNTDVQAVARRFGGGGHKNAAGCTVPGTLETARAAVLAAVFDVVENG